MKSFLNHFSVKHHAPHNCTYLVVLLFNNPDTLTYMFGEVNERVLNKWLKCSLTKEGIETKKVVVWLWSPSEEI